MSLAQKEKCKFLDYCNCHKVINFLFNVSDFSKVFKFKFVHLGGDEVNTGKFEKLFYL